jgi:hypothetical protein
MLRIGVSESAAELLGRHDLGLRLGGECDPDRCGREPNPTLYGYDKLNRVVSIDDQRSGDAKITFGYDKKGNRDKTVFPSSGSGESES